MAESGHYSRNGFLTSRGYREVAQRMLEHLEFDATAAKLYLDKVGSVSGLVEVEVMEDIAYDANHIELNHRLILNGN